MLDYTIAINKITIFISIRLQFLLLCNLFFLIMQLQLIIVFCIDTHIYPNICDTIALLLYFFLFLLITSFIIFWLKSSSYCFSDKFFLLFLNYISFRLFILSLKSGWYFRMLINKVQSILKL